MIKRRIDEFHIIDAILNCGANSENRGSDISLKLRRNIASNHLKFFLLARGGFWLGLCLQKISKELIWTHEKFRFLHLISPRSGTFGLVNRQKLAEKFRTASGVRALCGYIFHLLADIGVGPEVGKNGP